MHLGGVLVRKSQNAVKGSKEYLKSRKKWLLCSVGPVEGHLAKLSELNSFPDPSTTQKCRQLDWQSTSNRFESPTSGLRWSKVSLLPFASLVPTVVHDIVPDMSGFNKSQPKVDPT